MAKGKPRQQAHVPRPIRPDMEALPVEALSQVDRARLARSAERLVAEARRAEAAANQAADRLQALIREANAATKDLKAENATFLKTADTIRGLVKTAAETSVAQILAECVEEAVDDMTEEIRKGREEAVAKTLEEFDQLKGILFGVLEADGSAKKNPTDVRNVVHGLAFSRGILPVAASVPSPKEKK